MPMLMADVPLHDRPRERLLARGAEALSERELLAIVLRHGSRGVSALDLAGTLLAEYGSLAALAMARAEELARRPGVGEAKAGALVAAFRLGRLVASAASEESPIQGPEDIFQAARSELAGQRRERVLVLVCDAGNRLRRTEVVAAGSIDRSTLPIREILNCGSSPRRAGLRSSPTTTGRGSGAERRRSPCDGRGKKGGECRRPPVSRACRRRQAANPSQCQQSARTKDLV